MKFFARNVVSSMFTLVSRERPLFTDHDYFIDRLRRGQQLMRALPELEQSQLWVDACILVLGGYSTSAVVESPPPYNGV